MPKLVCLGASLTAGTISANFVQMVQDDFPHVTVINAGVNGDLAWNALQRLSENMIQHQPDAVSIMIGTNDVNCTLSDRNRFRYVEFNKLPILFPSLSWYEENLREIVARIQKETQARLVLSSLPMIGEDLSHIANQRLPDYNAVIKRVAEEAHAGFLDVYAAFIQHLEDHKEERKTLPPMMEYRDGLIAIGNAIALHSTGLTWNEVSARNGLLLTTDCLHLNETAAKLVSGLLGDWIKTWLSA